VANGEGGRRRLSAVWSGGVRNTRHGCRLLSLLGCSAAVTAKGFVTLGADLHRLLPPPPPRPNLTPPAYFLPASLPAHQPCLPALTCPDLPCPDLTCHALQVAYLVMQGQRPEVPPSSQLPGPDNDSFEGFPAYVELIR